MLTIIPSCGLGESWGAGGMMSGDIYKLTSPTLRRGKMRKSLLTEGDFNLNTKILSNVFMLFIKIFYFLDSKAQLVLTSKMSH